MTIEQRLIELETKFAYQEDALQILGAEIARQRKDIAHLEQRCKQLLERIASQADPVYRGGPRDEIPPHY